MLIINILKKCPLPVCYGDGKSSFLCAYQVTLPHFLCNLGIFHTTLDHPHGKLGRTDSRKIPPWKGYSLYVGIPFCPSICLYCSFSSYPLKLWAKRVDEYLDALCLEIRETARMMKNNKLDTIYIGGGKPTTLEPYQLKRLLDQLGESFGFDGLVEFTIGSI